MSAKIGRNEITGEPAPTPLSRGEASASPLPAEGSELPALARRAVEIFILERRVVALAPATASPLLNQRLPCFVCIKTIGRELRGCVGMVEPEKDTLAEEIIANAISAAIRDPRFLPGAAATGEFVRHRPRRVRRDCYGSSRPKTRATPPRHRRRQNGKSASSHRRRQGRDRAPRIT